MKNAIRLLLPRILGGGSSGWWAANAVLDADYENSRFRWDDQSFDSDAEFRTAIGGVVINTGTQIGPVAETGAPELLANTAFTDLTGWTSVLNGTSTAAANAGDALLTSDGSTGTGQGGAGLTCDITTETDETYVAEFIEAAGTAQLRLGNTLYGAEGGSIQLPGNTTRRQPMYAQSTTSKPYLFRAAAGTSRTSNLSIKKGIPWQGFDKTGSTVEITGVLPASFGTVGVLYSEDSNINSGAYVRIHLAADGSLRGTVRRQGVDQASFISAVLVAGAEFKVRMSWKANEVYWQVDDGLISTDVSAAIPRAGRVSIGVGPDDLLPWLGTISRVTLWAGGGIGQFIGEIADAIHMDGDSFMGGAYSIVLPNLVNALMDRTVYNTGSGSSTMAQISARIAALPASIKSKYTVIWDGDHNGYVDLSSYIAFYTTIADELGHSNFIFIPPCVNYGQADTSVEEAIRDEMLVQWPNNVLDWRDVLPLDGDGVPLEAMYHDSGGDVTHLGQTAMDLMAAAISDFITGESSIPANALMLGGYPIMMGGYYITKGD